MKVSFDGATRATFERFGAGASFEEVCGNVRALTSRLQGVRIRRPAVALQMTLMRDNVDELPALVELASELGADRVKAYHLFAFDDGVRPQSLMPMLEHYEQVVRPRTKQRARELGIEVELAEVSGGTVRDLVWGVERSAAPAGPGRALCTTASWRPRAMRDVLGATGSRQSRARRRRGIPRSRPPDSAPLERPDAAV